MLVLLLGCTKIDFEYSPKVIDWGEINFYDEMPENGYKEQNILFRNIGKKQISLNVSGFNKEYFCVVGETESDFVNITELESNQIFEISVSVCNYIEENGERDTDISGTFQITDQAKNNDIGSIDWSFTPTIQILGDSG
tara:strand:- start:50 stop:466 length:417 start_codon:yes stop_codon:yes gene_type:complete